MPTQADEEYLVQVSSSTVADDEKPAQIKSAEPLRTIDSDRCDACDEKHGEKYCGKCRQILCEDCWERWALHRQNDPRHPVVSYQEQ
jgi:hypothetical protein